MHESLSKACACCRFELLTRRQSELAGQPEAAYACALCAREYPWDAPFPELPKAWRESTLRELLQRCLRRDAAARPSAAALVDAIRGVLTHNPYAA